MCRDLAGQKAALGDTTESLALQQCLQFSGPIASGGAQAQPFHMDVAARVGTCSSAAHDSDQGSRGSSPGPCLHAQLG